MSSHSTLFWKQATVRDSSHLNRMELFRLAGFRLGWRVFVFLSIGSEKEKEVYRGYSIEIHASTFAAPKPDCKYCANAQRPIEIDQEVWHCFCGTVTSRSPEDLSIFCKTIILEFAKGMPAFQPVEAPAHPDTSSRVLVE